MARLPPQLPLEIIIDILSRLPVKPLLRFKCVCKSWHSLFSNNTQFAKIHLQRIKQDTKVNSHKLFLFTLPPISIDHEAYCNNSDGDIVTRELSLPPRELTPDLLFVKSCDGLICIVFDSKLIVWNPSTGQSKDLPLTNSFSNDMVFFEFGYDSRLDDYQIVKGVHSGSAEAVKMEVFSLKGNTWRTIQVIAPTTVSRLEPTSLNNGVLHWLSKVNDPCKKSVIVSVDLAEDKFLEMTPVPDYIPKDTRIYIKVLGDCLYVYAIDTVYWEAWIVEGSGTKASWTRLFKYCSNPTVFVWTECSLQILWVSKNGNILLNTDGWELVLYNPKEQTLKQYRVPNDGDDGFLATAYMETLVSPNAPDGSIIE